MFPKSIGRDITLQTILNFKARRNLCAISTGEMINISDTSTCCLYAVTTKKLSLILDVGLGMILLAF